MHFSIGSYAMGRRYREHPGKGKQEYVERRRGGQFKSWVPIPKSIRADARIKAKNRPKSPGHGNEGDYR